MIELTVHADRVVLTTADQFAFRSDELVYPAGRPDQAFTDELLSRLTNAPTVVVKAAEDGTAAAETRAAHRVLLSAFRKGGVTFTATGSYADDVVGDIPQSAGRKLVRAADPVVPVLPTDAAGAAEQARAAALAAETVDAGKNTGKATGKDAPVR